MSSRLHCGGIFLIVLFAFLLLPVISSSADTETIHYSYDNARQLTKVTYGDGTTIDYVYDLSGNRIFKTTTLAVLHRIIHRLQWATRHLQTAL